MEREVVGHQQVVEDRVPQQCRHGSWSVDTSMQWTFKRGNDLLFLQTNYERDLGEYVLRWQYGGGGEDLERYTNDFTFRRRLLQLEDDLRDWGWFPVQPSV